MPRAKKAPSPVEKRVYGVDVTPPPIGPKNHWISWTAKDNEHMQPLNSPPDERIVGIWCSGYTADDKPVMVAWVVAKTEASVKAAMMKEFPETAGIEWRFFETKPHGFGTGDRFPLTHDWMKERAKKAP